MMKKYLFFKLCNNFYSFKKKSNNLWIIGEFLTNYFVDDSLEYREKIKNNANFTLSFDDIYLRKKNNTVIFGDLYNPETSIYLNTKSIICALNLWIKLRKEKVKTITLEVNGENISIYSPLI